jgi:hypothetical protein
MQLFKTDPRLQKHPKIKLEASLLAKAIEPN